MLLLVGTAGFEPATPCSQSRCADQAAPRPVVMASELRRCYIPSLWRASAALTAHLPSGAAGEAMAAPSVDDRPLVRAVSPCGQQVIPHHRDLPCGRQRVRRPPGGGLQAPA